VPIFEPTEISAGTNHYEFHLCLHRSHLIISSVAYNQFPKSMFFLLFHVSVPNPTKIYNYNFKISQTCITLSITFHSKIHRLIFKNPSYKLTHHSGLRHELSFPARTLGSWFRIPLEEWMPAFILCLCCSVCRKRPCDGLIHRPRSPTDSL
jgi:hypothetical protein